MTSSLALHERMGVAAFLADVDRHMLELLDRRQGPVVSAARALIAAGGKRLRPLLVRAARPTDLDAEAVAEFDSVSIRAGAAVELIHTASLVHDDLLDGAQVRRGGPTVDALAGREVAIAAGDLLFSLAFETLAEARSGAYPDRMHHATRVLARTARTLAEGEALQARQLREPDLSEAAYLQRCAAKTGALFAAALQLGAILGGADAEDIATLAQFGSEVGVVFQLADDVLDCGDRATEATLGKRPGADIRDGTMTLPMLRAAAHDAEVRRVLAAPVPEAAIDGLLAQIRATGAIESARERAHTLRAEAELLLEPLAGRFELPLLHRVAAAAVDRIS